MIRTYGLTHMGLAARDPEGSFRFYERAFGVRKVYRDANMIQVQAFDAHGPVLVLLR